MDEGKGIVGFVVGVILGGIAGLLVGILLAPQAGEETRDVIREKGIELKARAEELSEEGRIRFQDAIEEGKTAATKKKEELTKTLEADKETKKASGKKSAA
ncbi:MAG TPA: YtxH domain-containing protein [Anaerolineae bacterium]|nr:YtxH domain-containing protein [Anaerolineae bacterium]